MLADEQLDLNEEQMPIFLWLRRCILRFQPPQIITEEENLIRQLRFQQMCVDRFALFGLVLAVAVLLHEIASLVHRVFLGTETFALVVLSVMVLLVFCVVIANCWFRGMDVRRRARILKLCRLQ